MKTFIVIWTLVHVQSGHTERGFYGGKYKTLAACQKANEVNYYTFKPDDDIGAMILRLDCVEASSVRKLK